MATISCFYFAGHSDQIACKHKTEDDLTDEVILCSDFKKIKDNKLHKILVNKLPNGASLTAIFDACHSGTLLDLEHYTCNNVWVPWLNKGKRQSDTIRNNIRRQDALTNTSVVLAPLIESESETYEPIPLNEPNPDNSFRRIRTAPCEDVSESLSSISFAFQIRRFQSMGDALGAVYQDKDNKSNLHDLISSRPMTSISTTFPVSEEDVHSDETPFFGSVQCSSPDDMWPRHCDGYCRDHGSYSTKGLHPHVVSLSSSRDSQVTWEDAGSSMTTFLIEILKKNKLPSYHHMMTELQHKLHSSMMEMHRYAKEQYQKGGNTGEYELEMNDFQDPQLGSITPLDMDDPFIL